MNTNILLPQDMAREAVLTMFEHLADWPIKTATCFRNAALGDESLFAISPALGITNQQDLDFIQGNISTAVAEGRMIDFGYVPNEIMKQDSVRSRHLFEAGELMHPYENWVGVMAWEGGMNGYYICPNPSSPAQTLVVELYGVSIPNLIDAILVYDIIGVEVIGEGNTVVHPHPTVINETMQTLHKRGANSIDPLVTMLRLLADASIPIVNVPAPDKLNKQRIKRGKPPIPDHTVVRTADYVAHWQATKPQTRPTRGAGHHASPVAHWRRSHKRTLASGLVVPVRSSKVNWRDTEEMHRLFYKVKPAGVKL